MDREFWRDNWVLLLCGSIGLTCTAVALSYMTGQPLLPQIDWGALLLPLVPGVIAILRGGVLAIAILVISLAAIVIIPRVRNRLAEWQEERNKARAARAKAAQRTAVASTLKVHDWREQGKPRTMVQVPYPHEIEAENRRLSEVYQGVRAIVGKHKPGGSTAIVPHQLLQELEEVIATLSRPQVVGNPAKNWRELARVIEWARGEQQLPVRATRDIFRGLGVQLPEADAKRGGAFNEWVKGLPPLSPTASVDPISDEKQATDATDGPTDAPSEEPRTEPQESREREEVKSNQIAARFTIPRAKRKPQRNVIT